MTCRCNDTQSVNVCTRELFSDKTKEAVVLDKSITEVKTFIEQLSELLFNEKTCIDIKALTGDDCALERRKMISVPMAMKQGIAGLQFMQSLYDLIADRADATLDEITSEFNDLWNENS